jgi:hypothetical protein
MPRCLYNRTDNIQAPLTLLSAPELLSSLIIARPLTTPQMTFDRY